MNEKLNQILSFYDFTVKNIEKFDKDKEVFKITDDNGINYFLKIYEKSGGYDITNGENIYYTYDQIKLESEILDLLSDSALKTAVPIKNKTGDFVTMLSFDSGGEPMYATITSFINAIPMEKSKILTTETAYLFGVAAAQFHLESEKKLLPLAINRPHKRHDYIQKIRTRLKYGMDIKVFTAEQFKMLEQCCEVILDCMTRLDEEPESNIGLVHTDIRPANCMFLSNQVIFIDFSRSVYSYYLYDLGHILLHGDFGGDKFIQNAVLRGYHLIKPLTKDHLFMMQAFFVMFLLTVMAESIEIGFENNAWMIHVLKWFKEEVHPGLISGKGYLDFSVYENIL